MTESKYFEIGKGLKNARNKARLTLEQLEEIIGVSKQTLSQYELGRNEPKLDRIYKIAKACDTDWYTLLESCRKK